MTTKNDVPESRSDADRRSERREFLILLSGGAALVGVGALAGCDNGSPTGPDSSQSSSSSASSESSESSASSESSESSSSSESSESSSSSESSESSESSISSESSESSS